MDDRLALMDQGSFLGLRALGHQPCFHATWVYGRPVDVPRLERFNEHLCRTLLGRLVERSPIPGGRHRWAAVDGAPPIEVEGEPRPRGAVTAWTEEFGDRGTDPEHGPGWRIGVLPLTDGGSAVTMIVPHTLGDGLCVLEAIADAVAGRSRRPDYPARGSRRRGAVARADLVGLLRGLPSVARAVVAAIRVARAQPRSARPARRPVAAIEAAPGPFHVPAASVRIAQSDWDAVAARLGGTSNTLVSAVAAMLGRRFGRTADDGSVSLAVPVSVRGPGDTRANALDSVTVAVPVTGLSHDLTGLRTATKSALGALAGRSHDLLAVLPLIPLLPRFVVRRAESAAMGAGAAPVGCSNYGDLDPAVMRIDGGEPDDFWVRLNEPGLTPADLAGIGGQAYLLSGRALGRVFVSAVVQPVGGGLDDATLRHHLEATLAEFGLGRLGDRVQSPKS